MSSRIRLTPGHGICEMTPGCSSSLVVADQHTEHKSLWAFDRVLVGLTIVRLVIAVLLVLGFPKIESHDAFYFHHGGDQDYYFEYGKVLAQGAFDQYFAVNLGQPALMAVAIRMFRASTFSDILPVLVLINGFLFGGLSVVVVGRLTQRLTGSLRAGYLAASIWAVMPWLLWLAFLLHPRGEWLQAPYVPGVAWLHGIPDGPAVFFALLALYFLVVWFDSSSVIWLIASGASLGVMLLFRFQLVLIVPLAILAVVLDSGVRAGLGLAVSATLAYMPQVIYNRVSAMLVGLYNVIPWLPGYLYFGVLDPVLNKLYLGNAELTPFFVLEVPENTKALMYLTVLMLGIVPLAGIVARWVLPIVRRSGWGRSVIIVSAPVAAIGASMLSPIFLENVFRFSLPAVPFLAVLAGLGGDVLLRAVLRPRVSVPI